MLALHGVSKSFYDPGRGEVRAVDDLTLELGAGVTALVGANGAGKSTLLRLIATLLEPDRGRVLVDGLDTRLDGEAVRARLGYLSTTTRLYQRLTSRELLKYAGGFYGLYGAQLNAAIAAQVDSFALSEFLDQRLDTLSTGQMQRVNLARTLLTDPAVLVLDEPTTGLDLLAAHQVMAAVDAARRPGRLILLATHQMTEVKRLADHLLIIKRGRLAFVGAPAALGSGDDFAAAVLNIISDGAAA